MLSKGNFYIFMERVRPEFFYLLIYGNCFSDLGSGGQKKKKKKSSENDQLTGHFQSFFFLISPEKTVRQTNSLD